MLSLGLCFLFYWDNSHEFLLPNYPPSYICCWHLFHCVEQTGLCSYRRPARPPVHSLIQIACSNSSLSVLHWFFSPGDLSIIIQTCCAFFHLKMMVGSHFFYLPAVILLLFFILWLSSEESSSFPISVSLFPFACALKSPNPMSLSLFFLSFFPYCSTDFWIFSNQAFTSVLCLPHLCPIVYAGQILVTSTLVSPMVNS